MSVALQLKEASERLSSNGFPRAAQLVDVAKPEPERMELDLSLLSPDAVVAPAAIEPIDATPPAPPPARRGRRGAQAQPPDPAPIAPSATPPPVAPERQAQINALYSAKARRDAERLQDCHGLSHVASG